MINTKLTFILLVFMNFFSFSSPYDCLAKPSDLIWTGLPSHALIIAVSDFEQVGQHGQKSSLARALESFVLTELFKEDWLYVEFIRGSKGHDFSYLRERGFEFVLNGTVISSERKNLAILKLTRVSNGEIISFSEDIRSQKPLSDFERLMSKMLSEMKVSVPEGRLLEDHFISITIPFEDAVANSFEAFSIPLQIKKVLEKKEIQHVKLQLWKDENIEPSSTASLKGVLSRKNSKVHMDLTFKDKYGFSLTHQITSDEGSEPTMALELGNWVSEIIRGMIKSDGTWREDVSSLGNANELYNMAFNKYSANEFDPALFYLRLAASMDPSNFRYRNLIVSSYLGKAEYELALSELRNIPTDNIDVFGADIAEVLFQKGSAYLGLHQYVEAAEIFQEVLKNNINQNAKYDAHLKLGEVYEKVEKHESAITHFLRAREIKGSEPEPYLGLARLFIVRDTFWLADLYLSLGLKEISGENSSLIMNEYLNLARSYLLKSEIDEALRIVKMAVDKEPKNLKAHLLGGEIYLLISDFSSAIESLKVAINLEDKDWAIFTNLSQAYVGAKEYQNALITLDDALEFIPNAPQLYAEKAETYRAMYQSLDSSIDTELAKKNDLQIKAIKAANSGIALDPQFGWGYSLLGQIYYDQGKWDIAITNARKGIDLNPGLLSPFKTLFLSLQRLGKNNKEISGIFEEIEIGYENQLWLKQQILYVYHDLLFDFEKAFQVSRSLVNYKPEMLTYNVGFVESSITTGRSLEVEKELLFIRHSWDLDYTARFIGLVISIVTYLLNENWDEAGATINELEDFRMNLSKYFYPEWKFTGLSEYLNNKYVEQSDVIILITNLIRIIENLEGEEELRNFTDWHNQAKEFLNDRISSKNQANLAIGNLALQ